jgi:type II secretion system protein I
MAPARAHERGFTLIEALVALTIVASVVITFLGIRTKALVDTMHARNWRLAREIADERLSELQAGAHETPPQSGAEVSLAEKYEEGWKYKILIGESAVSDAESELAELAAAGDEESTERSEWLQNRERYRKASAEGLSLREYEERLYEEEQLRLEETVPAEGEFEEVAVVVYFPRLDPDHPDDRDALMIKARISTMAISGLTTEQARIVAEARGEGAASTGAANATGTAAPATGEGGG